MQYPNLVQKKSLLQLLQWIRDPIGYMEEARRLYGDIFTSNLSGVGKFIMVSNPKANQQLLSVDRKQFLALGELNQIVRPLVGSRSIMLLSREEHKQRRKLILPSFHGDKVQNYGRSIADLTQEIFNQIPTGSTFIARETTQAISLQVILETVFGLSEGDRYQKLKEDLLQFTNFFSSPWSSAFLFISWLQQDWGAWSPWGRFIALQKRVDNLLYAEILDRRSHPDSSRNDILSLLMSATDESGNFLSDGELRDELISLLLAGHETTATAIAWALYWIHHHPEVYSKLKQELDSLGDNPDTHNPDTLAISRLPYLTAVCNETLRIYPVGMLTFVRLAVEPVEMLGYQLQPNMALAGCIYLTHHREDLYPDSKQFKPERFLERQFSPYEFMPFGGGSRRCAGEALASFEMKIVLATLIKNYRLELADSKPEKPQRRGLTLAPASGVKMIFKGKVDR
jgi:cytochrome P450 family 110